MIEAAYAVGEGQEVATWTVDQAGPYGTRPYAGQRWQPAEHPTRLPHEYLRQGTAKMLTLFHPATGAVRVTGVSSVTNAVLHGWVQEELTAILATLPPPAEEPHGEERRALWARWQEGLTVKPTLPGGSPAAADAPRAGQLGRPQDAVLCALAVCAGDHAPLYAGRGQLAEHDRVDPTHSQAARAGGALSADARRDHRLVGSGRPGLEPGPDAVCLGWQAGGPSAARPCTAACRRWVRRLHPSSPPPSAVRCGEMALCVTNDPSGGPHIASKTQTPVGQLSREPAWRVVNSSFRRCGGLGWQML